MSKPKTHKIVLETPVVGHEATRELEFAEPKWRDFTAIGPAYRWVPRGDGKMTIAPDHQNIAQYAERCLVEPSDPLVLGEVGLADSLKIEDLFCGFFLTAEGAAAGLKMSPKTSSDTSTGDQTTSPT